MLVVGVDLSGAELYRAPLPHGADPAPLSYDLGFIAEQPLGARRGPDGDLTLWFLARPVQGERRPPERPPGRDPGLMVVAPGQTTLRQRVAAYAVVVSERGLLATQYSDKTAVEGRWGMPGGGIDDGEEPADTVVREVQEETSQRIELGELVAVQTSHWIGRNPEGQVEDFHAIRLIYRGNCPEPSDPVVLDVGGTTADARWIPLDECRSVNWTANWRDAIEQLLHSP